MFKKSLFTTAIGIAISASGYCLDTITVPVKFINQTGDDIDYSLILTEGINNYPASPKKVIFGKDYGDQITNQPILSHGEQTSQKNYQTYVGGAEDYITFSMQTSHGDKLGLQQKPLDRSPHYCNITADDANYPLLLIYRDNGAGGRQLYEVPHSSSSCTFDLTSGYDFNRFQIEPSSPTPPPPVPHISNLDGKKNYQLELKKNPNLESEINQLYLSYTGFDRVMPGVNKTSIK